MHWHDGERRRVSPASGQDDLTHFVNWTDVGDVGVEAVIKVEPISSTINSNPTPVARWMRRRVSRSQATNDKGTSKYSPKNAGKGNGIRASAGNLSTAVPRSIRRL